METKDIMPTPCPRCKHLPRLIVECDDHVEYVFTRNHNTGNVDRVYIPEQYESSVRNTYMACDCRRVRITEGVSHMESAYNWSPEADYIRAVIGQWNDKIEGGIHAG